MLTCNEKGKVVSNVFPRKITGLFLFCSCNKLITFLYSIPQHVTKCKEENLKTTV